MIKLTLGKLYITYKIRAGRGATLTAEIESFVTALQQGGVIILLIRTYFGFLPPFWILPVIWILKRFFEYFLGWLDEKHLHWWKFENNYNSRNLNPFNQEVLQKINEIQEKLKTL